MTAAILGTETSELLDSVPLVPSVFAPPRCEDCGWWLPEDERGDYGLCELISHWGSESGKAWAELDEDLDGVSNPVLSTSRDFGCTQFEEKT